MVMAATALEYYPNYVRPKYMKKPLLGSLQQNVIDPRSLIGEALHRHVETVNHEMCEAGEEDTFFVADLGQVYRQYIRWKKNLPRIKPFYGTPH